MTRPYFQHSIEQLEALFDASRNDVATLERLAGELGHRKTPKAADLRKRVVQALGVAPKPKGKVAPPTALPQVAPAPKICKATAPAGSVSV